MDELESKVHYKRSVRILFKLHQFFGLVNFTYNRVTNRVEPSLRKRRIFRCSLGYCVLSSLALTFSGVVLLAFAVAADILHDRLFIQSEQFLMSIGITVMLINGLFISISYYTYRGTFVDTLNRLIVLSERIQKLTDDESLYYPGSFRKFIIFRVIVFVVIGFSMSLYRTGKLNILSCFLFLHCNALMELSFWTHVYGNLTLLCFYQKMNNRLNVFCATASQRKIKRFIRQMTSISYEIHRVKQHFNDVFNTLHVVYFFGLFIDINSIYELLKLVVIVVLNKVHFPVLKICFVVFRLTFCKSSGLQNFYFTSHIAEELAQSERIFRRKLLMMFHENEVLREDPEQQREIDLALMHHNIQDITTRSFRLFVVNRKFISVFVSEIVVTYAIVMFQQFIEEYVAATGERLQLLQGSVAQD